MGTPSLPYDECPPEPTGKYSPFTEDGRVRPLPRDILLPGDPSGYVPLGARLGWAPMPVRRPASEASKGHSMASLDNVIAFPGSRFRGGA
jgi:hypothetical protein